jgi:hypothetical protein
VSRFVSTILVMLPLVGSVPAAASAAKPVATICPDGSSGQSFLAGTTIKGDLIVPPSINCYLNSTAVKGDVLVQPQAASFVTYGTTKIQGDVTATDVPSVVMQGVTEIGGSLRLSGITDIAQLCCGAVVKGPIKITNSRGVVLFSNTLRDDVTLNGNQFLQVYDNRIRGKLSCRGNVEVAMGGEPNTAKGGKFGQCAVL